MFKLIREGVHFHFDDIYLCEKQSKLSFLSLTLCKSIYCISAAVASKIHSLSACQQLAPASAANWFIKGHAMYYHVYMRMHVKVTQLPLVRVWHRVSQVGFCLSLYGLAVWKREVNMTQSINQVRVVQRLKLLSYLILYSAYILSAGNLYS